MDFSDLRRFLRLVHHMGFLVLLRPGPYICAEWEMGGLPSRLLTVPGMVLRTWNAPWITAVSTYWSRLMPVVRQELLENGGSIAMVQIENEFGCACVCRHLKAVLHRFLHMKPLRQRVDQLW